MFTFLQLTLSGLATGAIYALVGLGFSLLWQASGTINFAQGEFVMLPAFCMLFCIENLHLPLWLAFLITCGLAMLTLGFVFNRVIVAPLRRYGVIPLVIATLGLSTGLQSTVKAVFGAEPQPFPSIFPSTLIHIGELTLSWADVGTLVLAGMIVFGMQLLLEKTLTGRAMQAVAQNTEGAEILGINVKRMVLLTFLANAVLACVAALLVTPTYLATFDMGSTLSLKAFYAAIIGGFNETRGALIGGLLIGVTENLVASYISPGYKDGVALLLFMVVIMFRPQGLLGKIEERKV
ncbi:MAG: branched-chain amino acid ABC transporter permease [Betaproteobacteria bacterium]|nr:branched-chain amino acid ABC transporter permease [Betaproteobacteria bacterium]MDE2124624.1 branched-chain amino acid ABC transporter permease [Betaproteobacteria bacterium]MDE2185809.1 branched-chain amino acid ABC transporter permease [Betaproteobacteria bacterium]MDE2324536.1 branched-chain amino acid ABC transporter permease [Betaproteobacteria bacterium]